MKLAILTRLPSYYTERRLQEEAEKRGHTVDMLRYPACYVSLSNGGSKMMYKGETLDRFDAVIPRSFAGTSTYGNAILRQFEVMGAYAANKSLAITRSVDALRTIQILSRENVPIPQTLFLREPDQADELIEHIKLPAVVKVASISRGGTVLAETRRAITALIRAFYIKDSTFMIQDYIHAEDSQSVRAIVVGTKVVASVKKTENAFSNDSNDASTSKYDKIAVLSEDAKKVAVKAARAIGLNICSVDMVLADEQAVVISLNPYFGLENIESITGRNLAGKIIDYVEINAKRATKKDRVGA